MSFQFVNKFKKNIYRGSLAKPLLKSRDNVVIRVPGTGTRESVRLKANAKQVSIIILIRI